MEKPFTPEALSEALAATFAAASLQTSADCAALDRLAGRLKADCLKALLAHWRAARREAETPRFDTFDPDACAEPDKLIVVEAEHTYAPLRFRMAKVGADLEAALGRRLTGADLDVAGDDEPGSLEAAYRKCARTAKPVYEHVRFDLGDGPPNTFERLVTPWSSDGRLVDRLVATAVISGSVSPEKSGEPQ